MINTTTTKTQKHLLSYTEVSSLDCICDSCYNSVKFFKRKFVPSKNQENTFNTIITLAKNYDNNGYVWR